MITAREALERLREGNHRFAAGTPTRRDLSGPARREELRDGQEPFAVILGCSDSRVPAEIVFDQGLGDLFVIRVAGNVVAPSQIGSVEFAVEAFGTPLVVVMGHSGCGAVTATLDALEQPETTRSRNLRAIVERIRPAVQELLVPGLAREHVLPRAVRANIRASADHLRHGSAILEQRIGEGALSVVGAEYSLESGEVVFVDEA